MFTVYKISETCADRDYRGAGKAWAAIINGEVVAIRYMDQPIPGSGDYEIPAWINAVQAHRTGLDESCLPVCRGSQSLRAMAEAAQACDDCPQPPRRDRYRPTELLTMARAALTALDKAAFMRHREKCRSELAEIGEVVSGMCSCFEFVAK